MSQISFFDGSQPLKITKPIRLIECFAGYGSQALALKYLGVEFEHWKIAEWAVKSIQAYKDMHFPDDNTDYSAEYSKEWLIDYLFEKGISADYNKPMTREQIARMGEDKIRTVYNNIIATHNLVSVTNVNGKDLEITNTDDYTYILTYSFPCFTKDSLVLTKNGYKKIIDVEVGDYVLTHDNTYQRVINKFDNGIHPIYSIRGMAIDEIRTTKNHKFYVREMKREGHFSKRIFGLPQWKQVCDISKKDYMGIAINQNSTIPKWDGVEYVWSDGRKSRHKNKISKMLECKDFWWVVGRYIGDGWIRNQGGIIICCGKHEKQELESKIGGLFNYSCVEDKSVYKFHISDKEVEKFVTPFGRGAKNKRLTNTIIDLPCELLEGFIEGYLSADGCFTNGVYKATSVSRELIYGVAQCVAKVYKTPYRIYRTKRHNTSKIQGREIKQNDTFELVFKKEKKIQDKAFYEDGFIWYPINSISQDGEEEVYDIEVENNHSFTVQNTIVHNCQDLSQAGLSKGMQKGSGTRSGLLWEIERMLDECEELPQILLMENVPQVIGEKNRDAFRDWFLKLESLGYKSWYTIMNGKDYEIPQNRERCFMVSALGDYYYEFPTTKPLKLRLKDMLETQVDEKYYLSDVTIERIKNWNAQQDPLKNIDKEKIVSPCITARGAGEEHSGMILIKCEQVGEIQGSGYNEMTGRVYGSNGLSPTVRTFCGGGQEIKIAEDEPRFYDYYNKTEIIGEYCGTLTTGTAHNGSGTFLVDEKNYIQRAIEDSKGKDCGFYCDQSPTFGYRKPIDGLARALKAEQHDSSVINNYRIRKLTPKECFRLMGVKDKDFERVARNQSNSSLYHCAGDSIITNCLMAIFKEML
jgi:DNA-cytosine methyltransferase